MIIISSIIILALIMIGVLVVWYYNKDSYIIKLRNNENWDLKPSFELTQGLSVITLYQGSKWYNFLIDTGSNNNHLASDCRAKVLIDKNKCGSTYGMTGEKIESMLGKATFFHNKHKYEFDVMIGDMDSAFKMLKNDTGVTIHGLLGSGFLHNYNKAIDYKNLMIHTVK